MDAEQTRPDEVATSAEDAADEPCMRIDADVDDRYFHALVDENSHRRSDGSTSTQTGGTGAGSLATLFRMITDNASRRIAEAKQRLAA